MSDLTQCWDCCSTYDWSYRHCPCCGATNANWNLAKAASEQNDLLDREERGPSESLAPDDLVRRLREWCRIDGNLGSRDLRLWREAAERIEADARMIAELEREQKAWRKFTEEANCTIDRSEKRAEKAERELAIAVEALDAMIVYTIQGQPGYRTHNGIAQAMPRKTERVVRKALAKIKGGRDAD